MGYMMGQTGMGQDADLDTTPFPQIGPQLRSCRNMLDGLQRERQTNPALFTRDLADRLNAAESDYSSMVGRYQGLRVAIGLEPEVGLSGLPVAVIYIGVIAGLFAAVAALVYAISLLRKDYNDTKALNQAAELGAKGDGAGQANILKAYFDQATKALETGFFPWLKDNLVIVAVGVGAAVLLKGK